VKLVIRNSNLGGGGYYATKTFSISMSIDSATDNFGPQVNGTLQVQDTSLQEVYVCLTGRYLRFKVLTYGHYSAGLNTLRFIRLRLAQVLSSKRFISLQRLCMCATLLTLSAATACLACPAHKTAPAGSTSSSKCCPAGASSPAGSSVCLQTYQVAQVPPEYHSILNVRICRSHAG